MEEDILEEQVGRLVGFMEQMLYSIRVLEQNCLSIFVETGVSLQELQVVVFLGKNGPSRMGDIAEHLFIGGSTLTAIMDKLVAKDFVVRTRSEEDRRIVLVSLGPGGERLFMDHRAIKERYSRDILEVLDADERRQHLELMEKITARIGRGRIASPLEGTRSLQEGKGVEPEPEA
jgi:DNA-binding MarR family transcriptional regulator